MTGAPVAHRVPPLVFLGPTLPRAVAQSICGGEYAGPIARGDLPRLAGHIPRAIVIIDGQFEHVRAVSPKEILSALDVGHAVYGAASMGALRAAECERFGMRGRGRVFDLYRDGILVRDDEVAVVYDPATGQPLSESLVAIRLGLADAVRDGVIDEASAGRVMDEVAAWPWHMRTLAAIVRLKDLDPPISKLVVHHLRANNVKVADAMSVLREVARGFVPPEVPPSTSTDLPQRPAPPSPVAALEHLPPTPKVGPWDSVRSVRPDETLERLEKVRSLVGITRVADVTGLDVLGVPNVVALRPSRDRLCNSAYSGKGLHIEDALAGAQMEALEVAVCHDDRLPLVSASWNGLVAAGRRAVHPDRLIPLPGAPMDLDSMPVEWVMGHELRSGEEVLVPADCVVFRRSPGCCFWKISSNGLASGNNLVEAAAHAIAEVIERDAEAHYRLATEYAHLPGLLHILAGPVRVSPPPGALAPPTEFPLVRLDRLVPELDSLVCRIRNAGIDVALRLITSDVRVPTLLCALHESTLDARQHLVQYGCGTHPDPLVAARRAITEATQSRVTAIQGVREDMAAGAICPADPPEDWFFPSDPGVDIADLPREVHADVREDLTFMLDALDAAALDSAVLVNLTNDLIGFPVLRAVVPGLELAFHSPDPDLVALGWRARRYLPYPASKSGSVA